MKKQFKLLTDKELLIRFAVIAFIVMMTVIVIILANKDNGKYQANSSGEYVSGIVTEVIKDDTEPDPNSEGLRLGEQQIKVKITSGVHKGEIHEVSNQLSVLYNIYVNKGTKVMLLVTPQTNGSYTISVYAYDRTIIVVGIVIIFLLALCLIGGKKGVKAVVGLIFTIAGMIGILIPLIRKGWPAVGVTWGIVIITTIICFVILDGIHIKSVSAMISTLIGVGIAGLCSVIVGRLAHITGYNMQEAENLMLVASDCRIHIKGLLLSGILIASLGAVMDVAMSISSAVYEIHQVNPEMRFRALFRSGMNVGRDAMGTMANTLILAFAGSSINLLLLVFSYGIPLFRLINTDEIVIEILRAMAGSIGIVCAVPAAAAVIPGILYLRKKGKKIN